MKDRKKISDPASSRIADERFASFETDPRYRLPSKKRINTKLDSRFSRMLRDEEFTATSKVDRYGRKVRSDSKKKALQRLYQVEEEEDREGSEDDELGGDEAFQREIRREYERDLRKKRDPARDGGFSTSESDNDFSSDSDLDSDISADGGENTIGISEGDMQRFQDQQADIENGQVTNRIAIVNLDWDHVKSVDLMALFSSFVPPNSGRIEKISIYPSEFGKNRMQREEIEGPPKALFKPEPAGLDAVDEGDEGSTESDSEDEDEEIKNSLIKEANDQDFDSDALRAYQLDRLRYFYAVMVCSNSKAAKAIYESTDGTEFQSSSNVIDLRFVPDDIAFDDEPRDECDTVPEVYRPVDFVTNALQSSKVKLTWDMHPEEASRKESIKRAFTGSRADVAENDLRAYLASDSEDAEQEAATTAGHDALGKDESRSSKRDLAREKMREALGLSANSHLPGIKDEPVGGMEITFTPALTGNRAGDEDDENETTIEKYKRKEKERKERKRQITKAKRAISDVDGGIESNLDGVHDGEKHPDLGFDDPFFTVGNSIPTSVSKTTVRKEERKRRREARIEAEAEASKQRTLLTEVMAGGVENDREAHLGHFDMNEILRTEKAKSKKSKKGKKPEMDSEGRTGLQQGFEMNVEDDRFKAVFDSHEFAIDPSNPKFKPTGGMKTLLEEGRKRKAGGQEEKSPTGKKPRRPKL